jgi:hypothetical protein
MKSKKPIRRGAKIMNRSIASMIARQIPTAVLILALVAGCVQNSLAQNKACALATPAEIQSAIGASPAWKPNSMPGGADFCMGQAGSYKIMLRLAQRSDTTGDKEKKGIAMAKQMGAQVDVKKFGDITCSTFIPPASMAQAGYNTTCSVFKNGQVGAIEITAKSQSEMVPIDKLRPVADKIAGRL